MIPVFVYGTLLSGECRSTIMDEIGATFIKDIKTKNKYTLKNMGAFPAVTLGGRTAIEGELYNVPKEGIKVLDQIEGAPDFYNQQYLEMEDNTSALTYVLPSQIAMQGGDIPSGSWKKR